ncbi:MAG TPA: sugar phosphate isomerase/epimerase [Reyranella sp.]|jgi:sugar phosphate isomerase/epimerase|nr:sugar phosphate isomerase/epimerase [Reyranella sp.]
MTRPLAIAHLTTLEVAPLPFVEMAARIGYEAVGLRLHPAYPGSPFYEIPAGSTLMRVLRTALADTGLSVHDIEFVVIDAAFDPASLAPVLDSAAELGAKRLSVCGDDTDKARLVAKFAAVCDLAANVGLGVDLEFMPWRTIGSLPAAAAVVREADRANGDVLVDALHLSRSGGVPEDLRGLPHDILRSVQLCDAPAARPATTDGLIKEARGGRLLPGDGDLPLGRLLAELPEHAVLSVEVPNSGYPPELHARRAYEAAQRLLATSQAAQWKGGAATAKS